MHFFKKISFCLLYLEFFSLKINNILPKNHYHKILLRFGTSHTKKNETFWNSTTKNEIYILRNEILRGNPCMDYRIMSLITKIEYDCHTLKKYFFSGVHKVYELYQLRWVCIFFIKYQSEGIHSFTVVILSTLYRHNKEERKINI